MTTAFTVLPEADRDLDAQAGYLAAHSGLETALRCYDAATARFAQIAGTPGIGARWLSTRLAHAELRTWRIEGFEKHLIFYRQAIDRVEIIRVLHGARDLDLALGSGPLD